MANETRSAQDNTLSGRKSKVTKFLSEPKDYSGSEESNPLTWLKHLNRIRKGLELNDEEIILIASSHLVGRAGLWWDAVEDSIAKWDQFVAQFKKQFAASLEDRWWNKIQTREQGDEETVDDVALSLQELFRLVQVTDESFQIRCLVQSLKFDIAYELEKNGLPKTWDGVVKEARQIELIMSKYKKPGFSTTAVPTSDVSHRPWKTGPSSVSSKQSVASDSIGSTLSELVEGMRALKINLVDRPQGNRNQNKESSKPAFKCYNCGEEGHRARDCKESGKDKGHQ